MQRAFKYLIFFLFLIIVIGFIIGQCNNDDDYGEDYKMEYVSDEQTEKKSGITSDVFFNDDIKFEDERSIVVGSIPFDESALEIPKLNNLLPEQVLTRIGYTTSYNKKTKNANWVAWHLTSDRLEKKCSRNRVPYYVDYDVTGPRQELGDWYNCPDSIQHGHMCPAGDNVWNSDAMAQSFLLTNMCPQNGVLNGGDWEYLEGRCRGWARHYGDVYIAAGPIYYGDSYKTMGANKVVIPDAFFKVILCMHKKPKALGFIYPNNGLHHNLDYYLLSVDEVESVTDIDFFFNLPDDIEDAVEACSDLSVW